MIARLRQRGFSFIEVLIALSILLVGSVSILALFALGAHHLVQRRIDARLAQVRPEVWTIVQEHLDQQKAGDLPPKITGRPLSQRDFTLDVDYGPGPWGGPRFVAHATILLRGQPVRVLKPIYLSRSTLDPR